MATAKLISMNDADDASVRSNCGCACTRTRAHSQSGADQTRSDQANPTQARADGLIKLLAIMEPYKQM